MKAKLLPKAPVFDTPKLTVPREVRAPAAAAAGGGAAQDRGQQFHACGGQAGHGRSPADVDRPYRRVRQFGNSDGECSDPEGADGRFWRPQRHSGTRASPTLTWWPPARARSICRQERETATERAGPKVLRARLPAPVSATGLHKPDKVTAAATGVAPRCRPRDFRPQQVQPGPSSAAAGGDWTCHDTCGNHLQAQSGLH